MSSLNNLLFNYKKYSIVKECFCSNNLDCSNSIAKAHSIQKNKAFLNLEEPINGNNKVYSLKDFIVDKNSQAIDLKPVGKSKASIFNGFCKFHDNNIFSLVDNNDFKLELEYVFLHTYRTFAFNYHQVIELLKYYKSGKSILNSDPNLLNVEIKKYESILPKFNNLKNILNKELSSKSFDIFNYCCRTIKRPIKLASASLITPIFSTKNIYLFPEKISLLILTIIPEDKHTFVLFSSFAGDKNGEILLDELSQLSNLDFEKAISSLLIFYTENTFFSPSIWNNLGKSGQKTLIEELNITKLKDIKFDSFFNSKINFFR